MAERAQPSKTEAIAPKGARRGLVLQRKCACGASAGPQAECDGCASKKALQRHTNTTHAEPQRGIPDSVNRVLMQPGRPLDADTRGFMESRFGNDFSAVRVHDDSAANASAHDVDAHAYTVGQDIVFGAGQYQPQTDSGRYLLAHELAHTVQQQGLQRSGISNLTDFGPDYRRLEHEADLAADRVMRGDSLVQRGLSAGGLRLSRAKKADAKPSARSDDDGKGEFTYNTTTYNREISLTTDQVPVKAKSKDSKFTTSVAEYEVDTLVLPAQKGEDALQVYKKNIKEVWSAYTWSGGPIPAARSREARDPTETLQRNWLKRHDHALNKAAHQRWEMVGGAGVFPRLPTGPTCEVDHIQELQVGGTNAPENLQLLDKVDNAASGGLIQQQLKYLAEAAFEDAKQALGRRPKRIELSFKNVEPSGKGGCTLCCELGKRFANKSITEKQDAVLVDYPVQLDGSKKEYKLKIPADRSKSVPLGPQNAAFANSVKGITFETFVRDPQGKGHDKLIASIDSKTISDRLSSKSELKLNVGVNGLITLPKVQNLKWDFKGASPGVFTSVSMGAEGLSAEGTLRPSIPFLPVLGVSLTPTTFRVGKGLDQIKSPIPGVKVTEASLGIELAPAFKPVGSLTLEFGGAKKLAMAKLSASVDESGLVFGGDLFVYLPGIDEAKGSVSYKDQQWTGAVHVESSKMQGKIPFVKSGAVDVFLKGGKVDASGKIFLQLPGENEAVIELAYSNARWLFRGHGKIKVKNPYLEPIEASLSYDGDLFIAKGRAGFKFSALQGTVDATYEHRAGKELIYGKGDIAINKGRAQGNILVELHPNHKVTGKGRLSYEIKKGMVATATIIVDEQQKITFDGELSFPDIQLFRRFPEKEEDNTIFKAEGSIPIPGASIGPIGLKVKLWGSLGYYYYVGPGVLTGVKAAVKFSPFEKDPDFSFNLKAKASVPAGGGIRGKVGADVVIDALIAEVGGGLNVEASAGLEGKVELGGEIGYSKEKFSVDASAYIGGQVVLAAKLNARVYAEAGVWKFKVRTEKTWELLGGKFDTGLSLGVRMPLHYDSVDGFRMPKLSDIKPEPADLKLSPSKMLSSLFGNASSAEKET